MLKWLDVQHAAAVDRLQAMQDGDESRIERSEAATDMRMINAIKARVQEMTALEYLEARGKMCRCKKISPCDACDEEEYCTVPFMELLEPRRAVEFVKGCKEEVEGYGH